jgi:glycine hydroxymethyltransferase
MKLNLSGKLYRFLSYGVTKDTNRIDFDQVAKLAREHQPKLIVAGASAYPREIPHEKFAEIAREIGSKLFVDMAHYAGLVAAGLHNNPVPVADFVTTTTHKTLRGPRGALILCREKHARAIDSAVFPGIQGGPLMHTIAAKAVAFREAFGETFRRDQTRTLENAGILAAELARGGLRIVSGGTDTHLFLVDLRSRRLTGRDVEKRLERIGVALNKNAIPFDPEKPMIASGVRLGTPAVTTRGMGPGEMRSIASIILEALATAPDAAAETALAEKVRRLCRDYPLYPWLRTPAAEKTPAAGR